MAVSIYLDNAATMRMDADAIAAMRPYLDTLYGNPAAIYSLAAKSYEATDRVREEIANALNASPEEIYFTSGGTESDNWALIGSFEESGAPRPHIITTKIEHPAILRTCEYLSGRGAEVTYLTPDAEGVVTPDQVKEAIRPETILISVMAANNEIGTIEPIREIGKIARAHHILFHTDAVQAFGHIPIDVRLEEVDLLSASAHKFGGPKGCGFLYIRKGVKIPSFHHGGEQERGRRAGTLDVPEIVGMGAAAKKSIRDMQARAAYERPLRDHMIHRIETEIPRVMLNGSRDNRLPNNVNFCIRDVEGESLLILLDRRGIAASAGSACAAGSLEPSHVLCAIGRSQAEAFEAVRFTLSHETTKEEIDCAVDALKECVSVIRGDA